MSARIIDGKAVAAEVRARVAKQVEELTASGSPAPGLATVLVGDDPASAIYVRRKHEACEEVGIRSFDHELPATTSQGELLELVDELAADDAVNGILVQLPLPEGLDADEVIERIPPGKDVDGLTRPAPACWPAGDPGLVPWHAGGGDRAAAKRRGRDRGLRGGGRGALEPGRAPRGQPAARRERHRHRLPQPHRRPRRGLPARRDPDRRRGLAAADHRRDDPARRHRDRRRHQPHRRRPGRRRRLRAGARGRRGDHPGPRRGRADDDRDAPLQHGCRRRRPLRWRRLLRASQPDLGGSTCNRTSRDFARAS